MKIIFKIKWLISDENILRLMPLDIKDNFNLRISSIIKDIITHPGLRLKIAQIKI